jgi:hypothetical protein
MLSIEKKFKIGQKVVFCSKGLYPSMTNSIGIIRDIPDGEYYFFGVEFKTGPQAGKRMACRESELSIFPVDK